LFGQEFVDLGSNALQIIQAQVDNRIPDVGNRVEVFEALDDHIPYDSTRHFGTP
jgi:hypothetical protein